MPENAPPEKPRSEKQRQASRRNGALSHGPVTPEGKAISSRNGLTHGLTSEALVLENEDPAEFDALLAAYTVAFQPQDKVESDCVHKMAFAKWREYRAWTTETGAFNMEMTREEENIDAEFSHFTESIRTAHALQASIARSAALRAIDRYETRYSRLFLSAFRFLQEYRKNHKHESRKIEFCKPNPSPSPAPDPEK
jgi:hypothetical protein